jgi:proteasome lid subunit RPN8/RPN11
VLILEGRAVEGMKRHGGEGYPREVCGLLVGRFKEGTRIRKVREARPAKNLDRDRSGDRYTLDPEDFRRIDEEARGRELEVVGVYHSHPDHPAVPSERDRRRAAEIWSSSESWSYFILGATQGGVASWRSWVLKSGVFREEPVEIEAEARW